MIKDIALLSDHNQIRELGSEAKYAILQELVRGAATCQQLSKVFGISKQQVHYNLNKLLGVDLIEIVKDNTNNAKEVYYRATAKNFVLDFSIGQNVNDNTVNNRTIIDKILSQEYKISLQKIAAKLIEDSLKLKAKDKLLITTGKYNLPLVEKILPEAARRGIATTLLYQDSDYIKTKNEEFSLSAYNADFERFNSLLSSHQVYLNLNGEARFYTLTDPKKIKLRNEHFAKSRAIIQKKKIRIAIMPGLLHDTIAENTIKSELQFWKALDTDYNKLCEKTCRISLDISARKNLHVTGIDTHFNCSVDKVLAECGSFGCEDFRSPIINLPGGEVLIIPKPRSMNGVISADQAYVFGQKVTKLMITIEHNEIKHYSAEQNFELLTRAIDQGGADGRKVALICLGTNENIHLDSIDLSFKHKSQGLMTIYWGENITFGGTVGGACEWFIPIENPRINNTNNGDYDE